MLPTGQVLLLIKDQGEGAFLDSCVTIKETFRQAYLSLFPEAIIASPHDLPFLEKIASTIQLVFYLDFGKPPIEAIKLLQNQASEEVKFYIHVYGDFVLNLPHWSTFFTDVKPSSLNLICLSHSQVKIAQDFSKVHAFQLDCPIAETLIAPASSKKTSSLRFLYAGRLNPEKNIIPLLEAFESFSAYAKSKLAVSPELLIAGKLDLAGTRQDPTKFTKALHFYEHFATMPGSSITFLGHIPRSKMFEVYASADYTLALSTAPYEDYGVAVRESLLVGTPVIVSACGGHLDLERGIQFVAPEITSQKILETFINIKLEQKDPTLAVYYQNHLSFEAFQKKLKTILKDLN
jgi:glycosyltransferase involved in cell wall biosynthesis